MNTFVDNMENEFNRTFTQNGCVTLESSLNANVDMFGMASAMRNKSNEMLSLFTKAFSEDSNLAVRNLFYLRDVRGGQGERSLFRNCARWIADNVDNDEFNKFISYIPEYGRWDDVFDILAYMLNSNDSRHRNKISSILNLINNQLLEDVRNYQEKKSISLLAKWFPLANNTKNKGKKRLANFLASNIFETEREARSIIVELRTYLKVLEQEISANKWSEINYSAVPSRANKKYTKAFKRHDNERYSSFIESVNRGEAKMNSGTLYPYEIVLNAGKGENKYTEWDAMWKSLPDYTNGKSAICVVDVSGSMGSFTPSCWEPNEYVKPIHVALSLGLYFAERNVGAFQNRFFTFSERPQLVKVQGTNLYQKLSNMSKADWGMNTNIETVFDKYLEIAVRSNPEDCPESVIIISDMEFDQASYPNRNKTMFETIKKKFRNFNVKLPNLIFWNVNASGRNVPVRYDESGTVLVSGCSPSTFKYVMEGKTPMEFMLDVLNGSRYSGINVFTGETK